MSLPPLPPCYVRDWDGEFSEAEEGTWLKKDEVLEYGRQCWNAAIEAALDVYYDYDGGDDLQDNTDVAIRALTLDTVSTPE